MGLLKRENQNRQLGNKGMSFVELLVVMAIIAIVAGGSITLIGLLSQGDAQKAARTTVTDLNDLKNRTLSIYGSFHGEIGVNDNEVIEVGIYKDTECLHRDVMGSRVSATFYAGGTVNGNAIEGSLGEYDLAQAGNRLVITYAQGTGAIESVKVGSNDVMLLDANCGYIKVYSGNTVFILKIYYKTGKIIAEI